MHNFTTKPVKQGLIHKDGTFLGFETAATCLKSGKTAEHKSSPKYNLQFGFGHENLTVEWSLLISWAYLKGGGETGSMYIGTFIYVTTLPIL